MLLMMLLLLLVTVLRPTPVLVNLPRNQSSINQSINQLVSQKITTHKKDKRFTI